MAAPGTGALCRVATSEGRSCTRRVLVLGSGAETTQSLGPPCQARSSRRRRQARPSGKRRRKRRQNDDQVSRRAPPAASERPGGGEGGTRACTRGPYLLFEVARSL
jgi:hypothetical protein